MFNSPVQTYSAHRSPSQTMEDIVAGPETTMSATGLKGDQKPRKMRASCDACSRAKVKCDKIRPNCQRCGNMSICCNYSPSMRLGKPRKHRNPDGSIKREVSPSGSYGSLGNRGELIPRTNTYDSSPEPTDPFYFGPRTPECHFQDAFITNTLNGSRSPAFSEGAGSVFNAWSNSESMMFGDQTHMFAPAPQYLPQHTAYHGHVRSTSSHSQPEMYASLDRQQPSPDASQQFLGVPNDVFVSKEEAITSPPPTVPAPLPTPPASIGRSTHNCTSFAFQVLSSLYTPPETQAHSGEFTSSSNGSPTLESVLSTNKAAVERLYALLSCDCTSDPHFSAVINLTITKILSWYQAIARAHGQRRFSSSEIHAETFMQLSTGPSTLESEAESTYRTNIVLSELPKIEKLIDRFSERYCRAGNEAETGIGSGMYLSMEASLRISVRETFKTIMSAAPEAIRRQMASRTNNRMRVNTV